MRTLSFVVGALPVIVLSALGVLGTGACSGGSSSAPSDPAAPAADAAPVVEHPDAAGDPDGEAGAPVACQRTPKADDHVRKVVVSHPFDAASQKAKAYEVLELSAAGQLTKTGTTFTMRTAFNEIAFTPDGKIGLVPQDDGSIGVFAFDDAGKVTVVNEGLTGKFYADHILVAKDGQHAFVLDANTEANGGGVHQFTIGCDGTLTYDGLVVTGGQAHAMTFMPGDPDRAVLIAYKALDSAPGSYAHRIDFSGAKPKRLASGPVFDDADAIASWVAVTNDGKYALVTDNGFSKGSRMAPVALGDMTKRATIATPNPAAVVMSPFGNALLLLSSDGADALHVVHYDATNDAQPFTIGALVTLLGGKTDLPTLASVIDRGTLKGRTLVAENLAVRQLAFAADGTITDVGAKVDFVDLTGIVGSLGVEP
jgi:DNA-binding beta-propeller fold protein YncE